MHIGRIEIDPSKFDKDIKADALPMLPTRNLVLFPNVMLPISLTRETSVKIAKSASEKKIPVGIVCQINPDIESPSGLGDLYDCGVAADVFEVIEMPDGSFTALIRSRQRIELLEEVSADEIPEALTARVKVLRDIQPGSKSKAEFDNLLKSIVDLASSVAENSNADKSLLNAIRSLPNDVEKLDFIATHVPASPEEKIKMLKKSVLLSRAKALLELLIVNQERARVYEEVMEKAKDRMNQNQRNAFLQTQLEAIKEELYGNSDEDDMAKLRSRAENAAVSPEIKEKLNSEISKLSRYSQSSPDYSVQYNYVDTLLSMPWTSHESMTDIKKARMVLDRDHYGLEAVKQRILEQIAVMINNPSVKAPILCLVGAPGVGKTSLGKSVAAALDRKYERVALGGVHDETEIRGHRRTYVGSMPGRIIKALQSAGCNNPVLLLDEVDKLGKSLHGDPGSALLEVLDPEQNSTFHDNYLEVPYDLSKVFFIATANSLSSVPTPLLDRMEIIEVPAYNMEEKIQIARRHLVPKQLVANGLDSSIDTFGITDEALAHIISSYTGRESGVRQLEKVIASLVRKRILAKLCEEPFPNPLQPVDIDRLIGDSGRRVFGHVGFSVRAQ